MAQVIHQFEPVFDDKSRILILGTIPSPKSREQGFYYGHPRNRFWKVLAAVLDEPEPVTTEDKKTFLLKHHIAVWDVLKSCDIDGAADSSIRNPVANDMNIVLGQADIRAVFTTGTKAMDLYRKYCEPSGHPPCQALPSPSPANCRMSEAVLIGEYHKIRSYIEEETGNDT